MENKHLKGPWMIENKIEHIFIGGHPHTIFPVVTEWDDEDGDGIGVACCILPNEDKNKKTLAYCLGNQKLIAAAPELLEACMTILNLMDKNEDFSGSDMEYYGDAMALCRNAIINATK